MLEYAWQLNAAYRMKKVIAAGPELGRRQTAELKTRRPVIGRAMSSGPSDCRGTFQHMGRRTVPTP